ncbi:PREDICTED: probable aspartic protease At2g35615 [Theobroma cacao]|uniref:Probable aspartic protease At2g35615 n=1 Tax=Theobroma cacao TaxID=3641 RepID=A0AB32VCU0_THECC|nr:PREDICTED: probable aspartic protease At2g35615 [Theobroma cacao]
MASTFRACSLLSAALVSVMCICLTHQLLVFSAAKAMPSSFSVDLIHRDSPISPLYNPLETRFDRLYNAYNRSISRINRFRPNPESSNNYTSKALQSDTVSSGGEYFMKFSIGTPPVSVLGIADTGSDLTWVQCKPCEQCYGQKPPLFDPRKSSTYKNLPCGSNSCNALDSSERVCDQQNACKYSYSYGDRSFTKGNVALEKFTIGVSTRSSPVLSFPNLVFGCGHSNGGTFDDVGSGIVGLGGGPLSLVKQLDKSIRGKFSYCLAPTAYAEEPCASSRIIFGTATESDAAAVSTPLVDKNPSTYYFITLEAISVGDRRLAYGGSSASPTEKLGNIIIDSGTTLTFLESEFYNSLESALEEAIEAKRVSDPKGLLSPCFKGAKDIDLPVITFHFSGADVKLQPWNTFAQVQEDMVCFTIVPSNDIAIFGNLSQMDFLVSYDLEERTVSFTPTDCTKPLM